MIEFRNLTKIFALRGQRKTIVDNVNLVLPTGRSLALLGRNGAGKTTLLKMIAGTMDPTSGHILSTGTISWPVGFSGSFNADMTGAQNIKFIARVYGVDSDELTEFVREFAELGKHFYLPYRTYSSGMRSRLSFGVSMGISFDTYLVDEVTAVGDASFRKKSAVLFKERMKNSGAIMVSHSGTQLKELCDCGAVLDNGKLTYFDDINEAIEVHQRNMGV